MRIVRFSLNKKIKYGVARNGHIFGYKGSPYSSFKPDDSKYKIKEVKLLPPCTPSKIVCLGVNYRSHAQEFNHKLPEIPLIFLKPSTAVIGTEDNIILPNKGRIDHECELAVVISKKGKDIPKSRAKDYILGYTCFNDVSDREAQKFDKQWTRAKGYDTFAAIGPWIETEIDASNLLVETYLNSECKQSSRTSNLVFNIPELLNFISGIMTLLPGDVIATGTPAGVGPIKANDVVEIKIEKIGTLRNYVVNKS